MGGAGMLKVREYSTEYEPDAEVWMWASTTRSDSLFQV